MDSLLNDKTKPQALLSVYVDEDKKIEEVNMIECYESGERGRHLQSDGDSYDNHTLEGGGFFDNDIKPDTLYHVYVHFHWYKSGYEYEEYDMELIILKVIEVKDNYRKFTEEEDDFYEQEKLKDKDEYVNGFEYSGNDSFGYNYSNTNAQLTFNDLNRFIRIVARDDIRLAHRMAGSFELKEALGELFQEDLHKIEQQRHKFKSFLKHNSKIRLRFDPKGYYVTNEQYSSMPYKEQIFITYDQIDNLEDDVLTTYSPEEILEYFYNAKGILNVFSESESG